MVEVILSILQHRGLISSVIGQPYPNGGREGNEAERGHTLPTSDNEPIRDTELQLVQQVLL